MGRLDSDWLVRKEWSQAISGGVGLRHDLFGATLSLLTAKLKLVSSAPNANYTGSVFILRIATSNSTSCAIDLYAKDPFKIYMVWRLSSQQR